MNRLKLSLRPRRAGFTLMEAIVAIVVLGVVVPPSVSMLHTAASARAGSIDTIRGTWIASAVMEQVIADVSSGHAGLGMGTLADATAYVETPGTGLRARLEPVMEGYPAGFSWTLSIGSLVGPAGTVTGDAARDVYRLVQVNVSWTGARGAETYTAGALVTDLRP